MWYEIWDYGQGCDASASEEALDGGWLKWGGAHGDDSDSTEIGEDVSYFPSTSDSFD